MAFGFIVENYHKVYSSSCHFIQTNNNSMYINRIMRLSNIIGKITVFYMTFVAQNIFSYSTL